MRTVLVVFTLAISVTIFTAPFQAAISQTLDYGDAPDPTYPTLLASNGASHVATGPMLGATRDPEIDGQPTADADGDDTGDTDDEDGVVFTSAYAPGGTVTVEVTASAGGLLNAWVDFNQDGDWIDAGEQVFSDEPLAGGVNNLAFSVPAAASTTAAPFARFRLDTAGGLAPDGQAGDGEVEDHRVVEAPPANGGGGGGGCGTLSSPGGGPSGLVQLLALGLLLAAMRRYWLARAGKAKGAVQVSGEVS